MFNYLQSLQLPYFKTFDDYVVKGAKIAYSIFRDNNIVMIFQSGIIFNLIIQKDENGGYEYILKR